MKRWIALSLLVLWFPAAMAADHRNVGPVRQAEAKEKVEYHGIAIVNRVEPIIGLVNVSHGDVPFAGWNTYTRDVRVRPKSLAKDLVPGMKIKFQLTAVDPLNYVITALEPVE